MGNRTRAENVSGGNTSVTRTTPNELNQISALTHSLNGAPAQTSGFAYDAAGNTTLIENADGSKTLFSYDDADRLVRIEQRTAADVRLGKSEFIYDYASRKAVSQEFTYTAGAWVKTDEKRRVFDGLDVVQERNSANEVTAQLVRDGNIGGILARSTAAGVSFFGYDGGGNVTLLTDENGDDVGRYRYDAFGNTLEAVGPRAGENPYRFSTKELHAASGLYDFGYRFYSAGLGRWINRDPISESGGVNLYAMVGNSLVNDVDNYGLAPVGWSDGMGGVAYPSSSRRATSTAKLDPRSEKNLKTLDPRMQVLARKHLSALKAAGIDARIIGGSRTYAEQNALYAQGRTKPGKRVTRARGGQSNHNFAMAYDIGIFVNGKYLSDGAKADALYTRAGVIGKECGLFWGGDWKDGAKDMPHFQHPDVPTPSVARERIKQGLDVLTGKKKR